MLCIIFTKKKLLAGVKTDRSHLLTINGNTHIDYEGKPAFIVLEAHLAEIVKTYKDFAAENNISLDEGISASLAFPVDGKASDREAIIQVLEQSGKHNISFIYGENLVVSFMAGLKEQKKVSDGNYLILESLDDYTNLCYHTKNADIEPVGEIKDIGKEALYYNEEFNAVPYKNFGRSAGNENLLNELLTEFSSSGLSVDMKGQTDLALQLMNPNEDYRFTVSRSTDLVSIEAEIKLTEEKYLDLLSVNRQKLDSKLSQDEISGLGIENVVLLGNFLKNKALQIYLEEDLKLNGKLVSIGQDMDLEEYNLIIDGLAYRTLEVLGAEKVKEEEIERQRIEAERKRQEEERKRLEEEKRQKISSELKIKEDRESLLKEIRENCVDPSKKEEYEEMYIARGGRLSIPDVVIKWNITEVLSAIELKQEEEKIGVATSDDDSSAPEVKAEPAKVVEKATKKEPVKEEPKVEEKTPEPIVEKKPEPKKPEPKKPEPVIEVSSNGKSSNGKSTKKAEPKPEPELVAVATKPAPKKKAEPVAKKVTKKAVVAEVKEEVIDETFPEPEVKTETKEVVKEVVKEEVSTENRNWTKEVKEAKMSLNDLFLIKGALKDPEFSTKKVTLYADHEPKVVKVLTSKEVASPEKVARFLKLYEKELSYYQEMSELGVAKEGLYYFRDFIERTTLKDYVNRIGLDKKLSIEELTSSELKFILQVFKEVRELTVPHTNLSEDNILIVSKRKWNLQKNVEVKFIGFTADETNEQGMIDEAHNIFSRLMGQDFYADFREKFQL